MEALCVMKERISSATAAEAEASNARHMTSVAASTQPYLQYPEPAAQSYTRRNHAHVPPPQPLGGTLSGATTNGVRPTRHSPDVTPVSIRSSTSSGTPRRSNPNPRSFSTPVGFASDQRRASYPDHYVGRVSHSLHDPEKVAHIRNATPNGPHTSHAFSAYLSEEEEDTKEHTVWILVSQRSSYVTKLARSY